MTNLSVMCLKFVSTTTMVPTSRFSQPAIEYVCIFFVSTLLFYLGVQNLLCTPSLCKRRNQGAVLLTVGAAALRRQQTPVLPSW